MGKNDKKGGDKGAKGKAGADAGKEAGGKAKGAQSINVRHILVWTAAPLRCSVLEALHTAADLVFLIVRKACEEGRGVGQAQ